MLDGGGSRVLTLMPLNLLQRRRPEDLGLRPDGDTALTDATTRAHPANVVDLAWASTDWTLGRAVRTARFWWIALGFLSGLFTWYAVQVHQTKYLIDIGFAPALAAWALGLVGFAGIAGQIGLGYLSDRIGREWVWTLSSVGFALCYTALLVMRSYPTPTLLYAMVVVQGLLGYGLASVYSAIPAEIFQGRHYGAVFGTLSLFSSGGAALGPWVAGIIHDATGSYALAFWVAILCERHLRYRDVARALRVASARSLAASRSSVRLLQAEPRPPRGPASAGRRAPYPFDSDRTSSSRRAEGVPSARRPGPPPAPPTRGTRRRPARGGGYL